MRFLSQGPELKIGFVMLGCVRHRKALSCPVSMMIFLVHSLLEVAGSRRRAPIGRRAFGRMQIFDVCCLVRNIMSKKHSTTCTHRTRIHDCKHKLSFLTQDKHRVAAQPINGYQSPRQ